MFAQPFHKNTIHFIFPYFQAILRPLIRRNEQVLNLLVVNLHHGAGDLVVDLVVFVALDPVKDFIASLRNDASIGSVTDHRVRLARACLSVSKKTGMVTVPSSI